MYMFTIPERMRAEEKRKESDICCEVDGVLIIILGSGIVMPALPCRTDCVMRYKMCLLPVFIYRL